MYTQTYTKIASLMAVDSIILDNVLMIIIVCLCRARDCVCVCMCKGYSFGLLAHSNQILDCECCLCTKMSSYENM